MFFRLRLRPCPPAISRHSALVTARTDQQAIWTILICFSVASHTASHRPNMRHQRRPESILSRSSETYMASEFPSGFCSGACRRQHARSCNDRRLQSKYSDTWHTSSIEGLQQMTAELLLTKTDIFSLSTSSAMKRSRKSAGAEPRAESTLEVPALPWAPEVEAEKLLNHVGGELLDAKLHHPALKRETAQRLARSMQRSTETNPCMLFKKI